MQYDLIAGWLGPWSQTLGLGSILLRVALSVLFSAVIGCERSSKRHSAGLRTFILVTIAGVSAMLIDQWLMSFSGVTLPVLSAAAALGMATISSNSILYSSRNQIKGLTTSVGLWCCGLLGVVLGAGLYTPAVVLFLVLQQIEGNLIYPHVVGSSVGLPSIWVLVAVTVGGNMFCILGILVFIPLCSVLYALFAMFVKKRLREREVPESRWNAQSGGAAAAGPEVSDKTGGSGNTAG